MPTSIIAVNADIINRFEQLNASGRLAHAYLFTGPELIGKSETALTLAKALNEGVTFDEARAGLSPEVFQKIIDHDPDIHLTDVPFGETIGIDVVREIIRQARLRPYFAPRKVFVIRNADRLTVDAANLFLKTLEEPTAESLFILCTASPEKILATIRSRCQAVHFAAGAYRRVASDLTKYYDVKASDAQFLTYFAEGCLGKALSLNNQEFSEHKNSLIDEFIFEPDIEAFVKELIKDKAQTKIFMDILLSWVRDALLIKNGLSTDQVTHADRVHDIEQFASRFAFDDLLDMYTDVVDAQRLLAGNFNLKLPLTIIKERMNG